MDKTRLANNGFKKYQDRNGTDRHKTLVSGLVDKTRLAFTQSVSKNKEGIGTDNPGFGGLEDRIRTGPAYTASKNEEGSGTGKPMSGGLEVKTRLANSV